MPSLFSRSRTASTPTKSANAGGAGYDEFGRVSSREAVVGRGINTVAAGGKSTKKKGGDKDRFRLRTLSSTAQRNSVELDESLSSIPDGSFLALELDPPRLETAPGEEHPKEHDYGYLSYQRHVVLGLEQVARLVDVVSAELGTRGLTTPFIFSALALDISFNSIKSLIRAFLRTCANTKSADAERQWRDEVRFAGPNELGMTLRWGLARLVRIHGGQEVRGLVAYEYYAEWRDAEASLNYPPAHFEAFLSQLTPVLGSLITDLLTLLSRFTAHSSSSGHTPPTLSPLFGPLFFGLGPAALAFHHTYVHYLRAVNAMEHLMLSFIRWQDWNTTQAGGSAASMGLPTRLKDWIRGYPSMLPSIQTARSRDETPQPRRGARTMRVVSVRRNVRMYSPDLVKTGASWATRPRGIPAQGENALATSKEWQRIAPPTLKLPPRYSDGYKKRMDMPPGFHPHTGPGASSMSSSPSTSSTVSSTSSTLVDDENFLEVKKGEVRSLTDLKWGEFETMGFADSVGSNKKLEFDLTEGARAARAAKRATLTWQDFSTAGFSRNDTPLSTTLQFSVPVTHTINSWPSHSAEIHRKLKKTQKALPPFGWDTEPVMGPEEVIEEAFLDVFCDLIYGGGWMDNERLEEHDRECNWALVEFKSLPVSRTNTVSGTGDPRTSTTLLLFEEFVPWEYRKQLGSSGRRRLPSLFSPVSKSKQWKPAATLNGRPYVIGHVPKSPTVREVEFEGLLRGNGSLAKIVTLDGTVRNSAAPNPARPTSAGGHVDFPNHQANPKLAPVRSATEPEPKRLTEDGRELPITPTKKSSRFRLPGGLPVGGPASTKKSGLVPAEAKPVDFETRLFAVSDDELNSMTSGRRAKEERRRSKDDAWVDILITSSSRRLGDQAAEMRTGPRSLRAGRSDPELASEQVALALASVRGKVFSDDDEDDEGMEPVSMSAEPENHGEPFPGEDQEEDAPPVPMKRLGYFDLHPERRPLSQITSEGGNMGRYSQGTDSYADGDDAYDGMGYGDRHAHISPSSNYSIETSEYEPSPEVIPDNEVEEYDDDAGSDIPSHVETMVVPPAADTNKSKTAALIEMYRERERSSASSPEQQSGHPSVVRGAIAKLNKEQAALPAVPPNAGIPNDPILTPPRLNVEGTGNLTPPRYVHGAPLHNVLEEEEEE
ncbi:hypothetical protein GLOTRDRAFT_117311 [Gloeophyllum trabeum ATCC 11539]|uniref:Meiotically up-regulated protein Msb1/Mug8 domain-containing protein n=1 Tax=Gloeophyllum trabeum (strain ATCC 11539 / FP-39264 / Madison 617) TaxID=670483 RepID=S7RGI1_GLOTA|nr:uncharacterized protein GLOTRDRAFT_117311 [Gloeophyllum trabeum ATCC 11539]EPQ53330.1 hypothetical protein GLOTRDRAFT_117311 [Gloeophyllum trabeum ATCC 11539]